jgi:heme/copper-type cytochrome/quinol oxidase subunit 3
MATVTTPAEPAVRPARAGRAEPGPELPKGTVSLGTILVVAADGMLLAALLAAWFLIKGGTPAWPPRDVQIDTYMATVVSITTVMASITAAWTVSAIRRNDQRNGTVAGALTLFLGLAMLNILWYDLTRTEFGVTDHAFGTLYHLLIGYQLVNLAIAVFALFVVAARALAGHFGAHGYDPLRSAAILWHFTTATWWTITLAVFVFSPHG